MIKFIKLIDMKIKDKTTMTMKERIINKLKGGKNRKMNNEPKAEYIAEQNVTIKGVIIRLTLKKVHNVTGTKHRAYSKIISSPLNDNPLLKINKIKERIAKMQEKLKMMNEMNEMNKNNSDDESESDI